MENNSLNELAKMKQSKKSNFKKECCTSFCFFLSLLSLIIFPFIVNNEISNCVAN